MSKTDSKDLSNQGSYQPAIKTRGKAAPERTDASIPGGASVIVRADVRSTKVVVMADSERQPKPSPADTSGK